MSNYLQVCSTSQRICIIFYIRVAIYALPLISFTEEKCKEIFFYIPHTQMHTDTYVSCILAFVARFTAEELPHSLKKHIEEGFQEWEENLCKVTGDNVSDN